MDTITWGVSVIKHDEIQDTELDYDDLNSWNDVRNEWKEKSDKLMNGEEI